MEEVYFTYYNYKPRLIVKFTLIMQTVPIVGDLIHVDPSSIKAISTKYKYRYIYKQFGITFKVVKRMKYLTTKMGEDWRITLKLVQELE